MLFIQFQDGKPDFFPVPKSDYFTFGFLLKIINC